MSLAHQITEELEVLLATLTEGELLPEQRTTLGQLLRDHPGARRFYMRYVELHVLLEWEAGAGVLDPADQGAVLQELLQLEDRAATSTVHQAKLPSPTRTYQVDRPSTREVGQVLWYLGTRRVVWGPIAAALALVVGLVVVISGPSGETPGESDSPAPPLRASESVVVATLTAERDAVWYRRPGEELYAGQRLTLTEGFAEITTKRGAIALLEAPCTFELIDHDNAIRLIKGKLVGICETESSKGLLVRAPLMDITDLGTRFGVDAASPSHTDVHVFEGRVEIQRPGALDTARGISAGRSLRASAGTPLLQTISHSAVDFSVIVPTVIRLPGTGQALAANQADTNWQITAVNGKPIEPAVSPVASDSAAYYLGFPEDPMESKFISWKPPSSPGAGDYFTYTFATSFNIPDGFDPDRLRLSVRFIADNALAAVVINGERVVIDGEVMIEFQRWRDFTLADHLVVGHNTIEFEVRNHYADRFATAGQVGLRVSWQLSTLKTLFEKNAWARP